MERLAWAMDGERVPAENPHTDPESPTGKIIPAAEEAG
jgi:hypothetical protein